MLKFKNMSLFRLAIFPGLCGIIIMLQTGCSIIQNNDPILEDSTMTYRPGKFIWHDLVTDDVSIISVLALRQGDGTHYRQ